MSNFIHLFESDERDVNVQVPTDNVINSNEQFDEILKSIANYEMDDYFLTLNSLNNIIDKRHIYEEKYDT